MLARLVIMDEEHVAPLQLWRGCGVDAGLGTLRGHDGREGRGGNGGRRREGRGKASIRLCRIARTCSGVRKNSADNGLIAHCMYQGNVSYSGVLTKPGEVE